jgi:ABC1 atypical kinase-like domain
MLPRRSQGAAAGPARVTALCTQATHIVVSTGTPVAIKVQRPGLLANIALDIFILRNCAKFVRRWKATNSNLPSLIDEWASSIYREMSYTNELRNAEEFADLFSHYPEVRRALWLMSSAGAIVAVRYQVLRMVCKLQNTSRSKVPDLHRLIWKSLMMSGPRAVCGSL